MDLSRRDLLSAAGAAALGATLGREALAQGLEMARIVTGFAPGGSTDAVCRRVAEKLAPAYARAVMVDNRPGAGGQIAVTHVKGAAPDGSTLLLTPMAILGVYPHTYSRLAYDPVADLAPVSMAVSYDLAFAVGPMVPESVRTLPEYLAWCKGSPTRALFGSPAMGSTLHFTGILLGRAAGVELTHVGFRGAQAAMMDLIGGQIPAVCAPVGDLLKYATAGKCRLLGTSGALRSRFTPNVATFAEQGYKDMAFSEWYGFYLPARASAAAVQKLNTALRQALTAPEVSEALAQLGLEAKPSSPQQLAAALKADAQRWGAVVRSIGFSAES